MRNLFLMLILLPLITYCKVTTQEEGRASGGEYGTIDFIGHCQKYLRAKKPVKKIEKLSDQKEGNKKSDEEKDKDSDEILLLMSYSITESSDGERYVECWINDGHREYKNDAVIRGGQAYLSRNYCTITYDLDDSSFGEFTFEYSSDWAWIHYEDQAIEYSFDTKFRTSECISLSR